jgi:predicted acetyltransferase
MTDSQGTRLVAASEANHTLLSNLLELYIHDLSAVFPKVQLGPDGRFGYPQLPLYWSEPEERFAYLIEQDGTLAGFILVTRGSPVSSDPDVLDVAEFFVLRRHRGTGVGRRAAFLLWHQRPGTWTVRAAEANPGAVAFWSHVVAAFTHGRARCRQRTQGSAAWQVFELETAMAAGEG